MRFLTSTYTVASRGRSAGMTGLLVSKDTTSEMIDR